MARTPTIQDCHLNIENWVITCEAEIVPLLSMRHNTMSLWKQETRHIKTPWSRYSRWKCRQHERLRKEQEKRHRWFDYHRKETSTSVSKPVGGLYQSSVEPTQRTNFAINLQEAAVSMRHVGVQYNPARIHALIMKFRRPSAAVLVFAAGRIVCTGAKSQPRAIYLLNVMIYLLRTHGYPGLRIKPGSWAVQNVVASARMPARINVRRMYEANRQHCTYEPDIFPGVTFRKDEYAQGVHKSTKNKIAILVFDTGSLVITGAKSEKALRSALEECLENIWNARVRTRKKRSKPNILTHQEPRVKKMATS
jgi:transcription initiation factor TFIID TATA-box-binding protein